MNDWDQCVTLLLKRKDRHPCQPKKTWNSLTRLLNAIILLALDSVLRDVRLTPPCQHYDSAPYHFRNPPPSRSFAHRQRRIVKLYCPSHLSWSHSAAFLQDVWILRTVHGDVGISPGERCVGIHWCRLPISNAKKKKKLRILESNENIYFFLRCRKDLGHIIFSHNNHPIRSCILVWYNPVETYIYKHRRYMK